MERASSDRTRDQEMLADDRPAIAADAREHERLDEYTDDRADDRVVIAIAEHERSTSTSAKTDVIVSMLAEHPDLSTAEIARRVPCSEPHVRRVRRERVLKEA